MCCFEQNAENKLFIDFELYSELRSRFSVIVLSSDY